MNETSDQQYERHIVLLDISLFILDLLDPNKIAEKAANKPFSLEVPSAFVTMIWAARAGNSLLYDFLYAYLVGIQQNELHIKSSDERIRTLIDATEEELKKGTKLAAERIVQKFAPLIEGAIRPPSELSEEFPTSREDSIGEVSWYPIRRYEPVIPVTQEELVQLRQAYVRELNLPVHPVFDTYFLQVYHAQRIGLAASPALRRQLISAGRDTFEALAGWVRRASILSTTSFDSGRYRDILNWFVEEYVREEWLGAVIGVFVDVTISYVTTRGPEVVLALTALSGATILHVALTAPGLTGRERGFLIALGFAVIVFVPLICIRPTWLFRPRIEAVCPPCPTPPVCETSQSGELSPEMVPTNQLPTPGNSAQPIDIDFCLYVVQPGDTLQSIASRFEVSEDALRAPNELLNSGIFQVHQVLRIDAPCCRSIDGHGVSHFVQRGETLYSIARRYATTVEDIARMNHIYDLRYIQAGQMLCIPSEGTQ